MKKIFPIVKKHIYLIIYLIIVACYGAAVYIFKPSFYNENNIFHIICGLLLTPIAIGIISVFLYVILKYILEKASDMDDTAIGVIVVIVSLIGVIYWECRPKAYDSQYVVNIYDDYNATYCRQGFVDIESDGESLSISRIYYDNDTYFDDVDSDAFYVSDLTDGGSVSVHFDNKSHNIVFMRKK